MLYNSCGWGLEMSPEMGTDLTFLLHHVSVVMPDIEPDHGELNWILVIGHECWYFTVTEFHTNE